MAVQLGQVVADLGGELVGDAYLPIQRLAPLASAVSGDLSFLSHARYASQAAGSQASALVLSVALRDSLAFSGARILVEDPYLYFAHLTQWWRQKHARVSFTGIHPSAVVHQDARVAAGADVGPFAVIEADAVVEQGARIGPHVVVGYGARIGADTILHARVTVGENCQVGQRCILHAGVVIGADGFGFAPHQGRWTKIEQLGAVRIGNDVEIGANTCIDRGALDDTVIEDGVKLDNLIQIGHNVRIGAHSAMAGCVGVAGSATIGAGCTVGGGAVVLGHLSLADGVHISAASVVTRSIREPGQYTGMFPIDDNASWEKNAASLKQLNRLRERLKAVERAIESATQNKTAS